MKRLHSFIGVAIILLFVFSIGCAGFDLAGMSRPDEMTVKEQAIVWMSIYNAQYDDYKATVKRGNLTENQKEILRVKKRVLTIAWDLLKTHAEYADTGQLPSKQFEAQLSNIIEQLLLGGIPWLLQF